MTGEIESMAESLRRTTVENKHLIGRKRKYRSAHKQIRLSIDGCLNSVATQELELAIMEADL